MLVTFRLVIRSLISCMRRVTRAHHVPQVLCGLRQTGGQHPDQGQDETTCRQSTHARMVSGAARTTASRVGPTGTETQTSLASKAGNTAFGSTFPCPRCLASHRVKTVVGDPTAETPSKPYA